MRYCLNDRYFTHNFKFCKRVFQNVTPCFFLPRLHLAYPVVKWIKKGMLPIGAIACARGALRK